MQDTTFLWHIIASHITNITTASRLSRTNQTLHTIVTEQCPSLRFSRAFLETVKSDTSIASLTSLIPLDSNIPDWFLKSNSITPPVDIIKDLVLGHLDIAIKASQQTQALHRNVSTTSKLMNQFIRDRCRYACYSGQDQLPQSSLLTRFGRFADDAEPFDLETIIVRVSLPSVSEVNDATDNGGVLFLACFTSKEYSDTTIKILIPRSTSVGTPLSKNGTIRKKGASEMDYEPCQARLCRLFNDGEVPPVTTIPPIWNHAPTIHWRSLYSKTLVLGNLVQEEALVGRLGKLVVESELNGEPVAPKMDILGGFGGFGRTFLEALFPCWKDVGPSSTPIPLISGTEWFPIWFPSVELLYSHPMAMRALCGVDEHLGRLLQGVVRREQERLVVVYEGVLIHETQLPWLEEVVVDEEDEDEDEDMEYEYLSDAELNDDEEEGEGRIRNLPASKAIDTEDESDPETSPLRFTGETVAVLLGSLKDSAVENAKDPERFYELTARLSFQGSAEAAAWNFRVECSGGSEHATIWWIPSEIANVCHALDSMEISDSNNDMEVVENEEESIDLSHHNSPIAIFSSDTAIITLPIHEQEALLEKFLASIEGVNEQDVFAHPIALIQFLIVAAFASSFSKLPYGKRIDKQELEILIAYRELWIPLFPTTPRDEYTVEDYMSMQHLLERNDPGRLMDRAFDLVELNWKSQ
ncbi:UNVERIFIED_CONTAM: hypothetical protein HDU68_000475 [Siphonaria sp. JEL0065]|nr:hypothetical protein HDU68_000475 [Siphonaria sp. JEL0065]